MSRERGTGHLFQKPGRKVWIMQYYVEGKRYRESSKTRDKTLAGKLLIKRLNQVNQPKEVEAFKPTPRVAVRVEDLMEDLKLYNQLHRSKKRPARKKNELHYRWNLHLKPVFGPVVADQLTTVMVEQYKVQRQAEGAANATINRELALQRRMFNRARHTNPPRTTNTIGIDLLPEDNVRKGFVEDAEFVRLTGACRPEDFWLRTFLELAYTYPSRHGELLGLRVRQVNWADNTVRLEADQTKTNKARTWYLTPRAVELLRACCEGKKADACVLTREGAQVKEMRYAWAAICVKAELGEYVCKACGVAAREFKCSECGATRQKGFSYRGLIVHDMRRSAAKRLLRAGVDEGTIMKMGGWLTRAMFDRHMIDSVDNQRRFQQFPD